jgi:hypothetical protein
MAVEVANRPAGTAYKAGGWKGTSRLSRRDSPSDAEYLLKMAFCGFDGLANLRESERQHRDGFRMSVRLLIGNQLHTRSLSALGNL